MAEDSHLIPVRRAEIVIGKPLPWAVYDSNRMLLLNKGVVVTSEFQLQTLIEKGLYRKGREHSALPLRTIERDKGEESADGRADADGGAIISFDRVRLTPGDLVQLRPLSDDATAERYNVRYVGMLKGKSLLVTAPMVEDKVLFIREGQVFLVRAFAGLDICGFKAQVLASRSHPFPYLHLKYPNEVQSTRVRRALRASTNIIVAVYGEEGGALMASGRIVDLSIGGAKIVSSRPLGDKDTQIFLSFKVNFDEIDEIVTTPAWIRSTAQETNEKGETMYTTGVQFAELSQTQRLLIRNLVYAQLHNDSA